MKYHLSSILTMMRPGAEWILNGDTLDGLNWIETTQAKPTQAEIDAFVVTQTFKDARMAAYPNIGDQLDAIWAWFSANQAPLPKQTSDMLAQIQSVKAQIPKPAQGGPVAPSSPA